MTAAEQLLPSVNGLDTVKTNADASVDVYFGPGKPAEAADTNWIQTVDGLNFLVAVRLYGPGVEFFDQTWKPDDLVKID
ncbi:putative signal peptide protein [Metarhizium anisopliae]